MWHGIGELNELLYNAETCLVVDADIPKAVVAYGDDGGEELTHCAASCLAEQCGGDLQSIICFAYDPVLG